METTFPIIRVISNAPGHFHKIHVETVRQILEKQATTITAEGDFENQSKICFPIITPGTSNKTLVNAWEEMLDSIESTKPKPPPPAPTEKEEEEKPDEEPREIPPMALGVILNTRKFETLDTVGFEKTTELFQVPTLIIYIYNQIEGDWSDFSFNKRSDIMFRQFLSMVINSPTKQFLVLFDQQQLDYNWKVIRKAKNGGVGDTEIMGMMTNRPWDNRVMIVDARPDATLLPDNEYIYHTTDILKNVTFDEYHTRVHAHRVFIPIDVEALKKPAEDPMDHYTIALREIVLFHLSRSEQFIVLYKDVCKVPDLL